MKTLSTKQFIGWTRTEVRDFVKDYYKKNVQGKSITNTDKRIRILFNRTGRKKTTGSFMSNEEAVMMLHIMSILRDALFCNFGKPKPKHAKHKAIGFINFQSKVIIDGCVKGFRIPVMITASGKFQYDLHENLKK